jgi:predicted permease
MPRRFVAYLLGLLRRRKIERELDEELQFHIAMESAANEARGVSPAEARRLALRDLGGAVQTREAVRDVRSLWVDHVWRDLQYGVRRLRRQPGFAMAAVLTLALGIGANTAIFSIADATVLRPLPYDESDRLVQLAVRDAERDLSSNGIGPRDFLDWREHQQVFDAIAAHISRGAVLLGGGEPQEVQLGLVTADFFDVLRVRPSQGRAFLREEEVRGNHTVAMLTHRLARTRFGGVDGVLGRSLQINGEPYEIVGILPEGFEYPADGGPDIFAPLTFSDADRQHGAPQNMVYACIGRLRDSVTVGEAEAGMTRLQAGMAAQQSRYNQGFSAVALTPLLERHVGGSRPLMLLLLAASGLVLLMACANVSNLILANGTTRVQELTVRTALGAGAGRLARQLFVETLLLAGIGAAVGVTFTWWSLGILRQMVPPHLPRSAEITIDLRVLAFATAATVLCGSICGLLPALQLRRFDVATRLKDASGATFGPLRVRLRQTIAFAEVALAVMLLVGAGLFMTSFIRLMRIDPGFSASNLLSLRLSLPRLPGRDAPDAVRFTRIIDAVRRAPGVTGAGIASSGGPYTRPRLSLSTRVEIEGGAAESSTDRIGLQTVGQGFFEVLNAPLRSGRLFHPRDRNGAPFVAIVNESAARRFWGGADPLGSRIVIDQRQYEIVGVVGDIRYVSLETPPGPQLYLAMEQTSARAGTLLVRAEGDPLRLLPAVKAAIWSVDPDQPVGVVATGDSLLEQATSVRRFNMLLMVIFGGLALALAATGVYGVMAFIVSHRTREIGVRLALGARGIEVARGVLREAAMVLGAGLALGLLCAWWLGAAVESFLYQVAPRDPLVFCGAAILLAIAGVTACWLPARRAAAVDPVIALRAP